MFWVSFVLSDFEQQHEEQEEETVTILMYFGAIQGVEPPPHSSPWVSGNMPPMPVVEDFRNQQLARQEKVIQELTFQSIQFKFKF